MFEIIKLNQSAGGYWYIRHYVNHKWVVLPGRYDSQKAAELYIEKHLKE